MQLKAKMKASYVTDFGNQNKGVKLTAVTGDSEENKTFSKYTPNATLEMTINNPAALDFFVAGDEYYLTFDKA